MNTPTRATPAIDDDTVVEKSLDRTSEVWDDGVGRGFMIGPTTETLDLLVDLVDDS